MSRRSLGLLVGGLLLIVPASAAAAPTVTVRVEASSATLLDSTSVTLPGAAASVGPANCAGDTAYAALDLATGQNWDRSAFAQTILGETRGANYPAPDYWAEWLGRAGAYVFGNGLCNDHLQEGDEVLMQADDAKPDFTSLYPAIALAGVPAQIAPGVAMTVTAMEYQVDPLTFVPGPAPAVGATVASGSVTATTDATGKASLMLTARGPAKVRVTKGFARSHSLPVCVTDGADGFCGTTKPGSAATTTAAPVVVAPAADIAPALPSVASLGEQQHFARGKAPRELEGSVAADASGVKAVLLRLTRRDGRRCEGYNGTKEAWAKLTHCGTEYGTFFSIGSSATWSYLLPKALGKGRYVLDVRTVDGAGNVTRGAERGATRAPRTRVVFFVN